MRPIVKWVGGKTQILDEIKKMVPPNINKYYEPFVGGGALFLNIKFKKAYINDINILLMNLYKIIRDNSEQLLIELKKIRSDNNSISKSYYLNIRNEFNKRIIENKHDVLTATYFIYLNKTCFNGLYRVNSKGLFNVPFNERKNINFFNENDIKEMSNYLKKVRIENKDFEQICKYARKGDFFFFDPPYVKLKENTFSAYDVKEFDEKENIKLAKLFEKLSKRKINCMLTNHDTKFIRDLYKNFYFKEIDVRRSINCDGNNRYGREVIITNYSLN